MSSPNHRYNDVTAALSAIETLVNVIRAGDLGATMGNEDPLFDLFAECDGGWGDYAYGIEPGDLRDDVSRAWGDSSIIALRIVVRGQRAMGDYRPILVVPTYTITRYR